MVHNNDVIISGIASQITSLTIVYPTVYSDADKKKIVKTPRHWPLCGIPRTNGQWRGKCTIVWLTYWGLVTHICNKLTIIGSDNRLSPGRHQAIIWTNAGILLIKPLGTNFNEMLVAILAFSLMKMRLEVSSAKWRPFCLGLKRSRWTASLKVIYVYERPPYSTLYDTKATFNKHAVFKDWNIKTWLIQTRIYLAKYQISKTPIQVTQVNYCACGLGIIF